MGIDYGRIGQVNRNRATGIHYGVISQNSLDSEAINEAITAGADYGKPHCPKCGNEVKASDDTTLFDDYEFDEGETFEETTVENGNDIPEWFDHKDFTCLACKYCFWSDEAYSDEMIGWSHDSDGYKLADCLTNDVFVLESPYYTYAEFCSPCVPGACDLDTPIEYNCTGASCSFDHGTPKTYCLGHEWFDSGKAPYKVFRVSDNIEVLPD